MRRSIILFFAVILAAAPFGIVNAETPEQINYQGYLTDSEGEPLDGTFMFFFSIYDMETGGTALWSEIHSQVPVESGLFHIILGSQLPIEIDFNGNFWLEVGVQGEIQEPRLPLSSVGQAFRASQADDVYDMEIHPQNVIITGYGEVINSDGQWTGDTAGLAGPTGPQGETGPAGSQGPQGDTGPVGPEGPQGDEGMQGPQGNTGPAGPQGPQGDTGPVGPEGPQGDEGMQGPQGNTGPVGPQGPQGDTGLVGPEGPQGDEGMQGPQGNTGPVGPHGPQGDTGLVGPEGPQGDVGMQGPQGNTGPVGPQGPQGDTGPVGPEGPQGDEGPVGPQGPQGETGQMGPEGPQGDEGPVGPTGPQGDTGPVGGSDKQFLYNNDGQTAGAEVYYDSSTGNVGIGTQSPTESLDVNENVKADYFIGDGSQLTGIASSSIVVPVGGILAWHKNLPGVPALPSNFVECNGQLLDDPDSPLDGQTIPNLNGQNRILEGHTASGATNEENYLPSHTHNFKKDPEGTARAIEVCSTYQNTGNWGLILNATAGAPKQFFQVVWVMRVK